MASGQRSCSCTHLLPSWWTLPGHKNEDDFQLNMHPSWYFIKEELYRAQIRERITHLQRRAMLHDIQQPLDWVPWRRFAKQANNRVQTALQAWRQGALFTKSSEGTEAGHLHCPHCNLQPTSHGNTPDMAMQRGQCTLPTTGSRRPNRTRAGHQP